MVRECAQITRLICSILSPKTILLAATLDCLPALVQESNGHSHAWSGNKGAWQYHGELSEMEQPWWVHGWKMPVQATMHTDIGTVGDGPWGFSESQKKGQETSKWRLSSCSEWWVATSCWTSAYPRWPSLCLPAGEAWRTSSLPSHGHEYCFHRGEKRKISRNYKVAHNQISNLKIPEKNSILHRFKRMTRW